MMGDIHKRNFFNHIHKDTIQKVLLPKYENMGWVNVGEEDNVVKIQKTIPICYSGSLIQQNFGETVDNHGYLIWDVAEKTYVERNIHNNNSYYKFKISSINDVDEGTEILMN